jgi:protein tyrosine phosphatase (PTP) superfamily phosphohydrolase (DUF442 family)
MDPRPRTALAAAAVAAWLAGCSAPKPTGPTLAELQATQLQDVATPAPNLISSGQPTEAQLRQLAKLGVRRFVSLRPATEPGAGWEEDRAPALGIRFVRVPVAGASDVTIANAKRLADALGAGDEPALVYCANKNRVGALLALKAFHVDRRSAAEALQLGRAAGLGSLEPRVLEQLQ